MWKKNYKGLWKYYNARPGQLSRVEKFPGATSYYSAGAESVQQRIVYHYDTHPLQTNFVGNTVGRIAAIEYNPDQYGLNYTRESIVIRRE